MIIASSRIVLLLDRELLRSRSVTIVNIHIRPLVVQAVGVVLDLHALVRVDHRADRFRHTVVEPFLGVGAVAVVQLDVGSIGRIAVAQINTQVLMVAHLDGQSVKIPLLVFIGIILGPQLDVGAPFGAGM